MRIALTLEYDGSAFHGWQTQKGLRTVQNELEQALSKVADQTIRVHCAGRTDTGVHAKHQVVHFDTVAQRSTTAWTFGSNYFLPPDISIHAAYLVPEDFHARFSASARSYEYWIDNRRTKPALHYQKITWFARPLDADLMHAAAQALLGTHDFSSFRASGCQAKSPVRTLTHIEVTRQQHCVILKITANAFLHHMVRNIIGSLLPIGWGLQPIESLSKILAMKQRAQAGITAPPAGLYLSQVHYPLPLTGPHEPP